MEHYSLEGFMLWKNSFEVIDFIWEETQYDDVLQGCFVESPNKLGWDKSTCQVYWNTQIYSDATALNPERISICVGPKGKSGICK